MYERLDNCPLCNSGQFHNQIIVKDHSISGESFAIVQCDKCNLSFTNPRPSTTEIKRFYKSEEYISHTDATRNIFDLVYKTARFFTLRSKLKLIESYNTKKYLLDYGCGTGDFLKKCQDHNWQVKGIEPNDKARNIAKDKLNIDISFSLTNLEKGEHFNIITLWHVLEHVHDLNKTMSQLKDRLKAKGKLILALPNNESWDANFYKENWAAYDVPRHLYHFNPGTVKNLAKHHKLTISKIIPQKLDSYYVSLLSEKYIHSLNKPFKAIQTGLKSNRKARINNQYSSLIYVLTK